MKQFWILRLRSGQVLDFGFSIGKLKSKKVFGFALSFLCSLLLAPPFSAAAEQSAGGMPRIGYLGTGSGLGAYGEAFRQGLRALGYIEGRNIAIEYRFAEGKLDRLPGLAIELVGLRVKLIVAMAPVAVRAAMAVSQTIPIVMTNGSDPIGSGLVSSLAHPGGNVTGLASNEMTLTGKRLELFKEAIPKLSRVAVLWNPDALTPKLALKEIQSAAPALGLQLESLEVRAPSEFDAAFRAAKARAGGVIVFSDVVTRSNRQRIVDLAAKYRLPTNYSEDDFVEAGGLLSYGPNLSDMYRRAAYYVDKILKGAKPPDLPVEQPMKFELVINLKAAKQIGLTIPPNVLARADKVIR